MHVIIYGLLLAVATFFATAESKSAALSLEVVSCGERAPRSTDETGKVDEDDDGFNKYLIVAIVVAVFVVVMVCANCILCLRNLLRFGICPPMCQQCDDSCCNCFRHKQRGGAVY